jgi:hypothetical protein
VTNRRRRRVWHDQDAAPLPHWTDCRRSIRRREGVKGGMRGACLRPTMLRTVHFVTDSQQADRLRAAWPPDARVSLEFVDCPGPSLTRCAADLVRREAELLGAQVTVILQTVGTPLRMVKRCSPVHVGCCTSLLYGTTSASRTLSRSR